MAIRKKPETMTIAEYNNLLMDDALGMLLKARDDINKARDNIAEARDEMYDAIHAITTVYTQMRLDV